MLCRPCRGTAAPGTAAKAREAADSAPSARADDLPAEPLGLAAGHGEQPWRGRAAVTAGPPCADLVYLHHGGAGRDRL